MLLWILFGAMMIVGALFVTWPMYWHVRRLSPALVSAALLVLAASGSTYVYLGSPGAPSGPAATPSVPAMVASLKARLDENPRDIAGWKMLGRSSLQLRDFDGAVSAFERAVELESSEDAQTLADLGEAVLMQEDDRVSGRAAQLFESALAISPNNPKALFYGGIAAIERGDRAQAANRWEALLALSPPENVQDVLRQRIAEWRAEPGAEPEAVAASVEVSIEVALAEAAIADLDDDNSVFVIARIPGQPSPPIAVARRKVGELPATVTLSDADSMIPGRRLSQFPNLEIVVRASRSGNPIQAAGDWIGSQVLDTSETTSTSITVDQQVLEDR